MLGIPMRTLMKFLNIENIMKIVTFNNFIKGSQGYPKHLAPPPNVEFTKNT